LGSGWLFHLPLVAVIVFYDNNATQYETIFSRGDRQTPPEQKNNKQNKTKVENRKIYLTGKTRQT
jgi:hypothetical protein